MESAVDKVGHASEQIEVVNVALHSITRVTNVVAESAADISAMLEQQSKASLEVANSMEQMSVLTEENMGAILNVNESTKKLNLTSGALHKLVQGFKV
jgi:aerotaxis receptor